MASTPLFFVTRDSIENDRVVITGADASHIVRVLRLREGAPLLVSDMQRNEYTVTITCASPQRVECAILSRASPTRKARTASRCIRRFRRRTSWSLSCRRPWSWEPPRWCPS